MRDDFDTDLLRTFVAITETGGFARAGARVGRTQSTVSLQMKRLEAKAGANLFRRDGRRMVLTQDGQCLLRYARRILDLHDEARLAVEGTGIGGTVRFGMIQDLAEGVLPDILGRFSRAHPGLRLEVRVDNTAALAEALGSGGLDLALTVGRRGSGVEVLRRERLVWIADSASNGSGIRPVQLVLCDAPCGIRDLALGALEHERIPYRVAFTSPSLAVVKAAVRAGLGITARGVSTLAGGLVALEDGHGLPELPRLDLTLERAAGATPPPVEKLAALLTAAVT